MSKGVSIEDDIVLSPEHRELVRQNGVIEAGPYRITIDHDMVRLECLRSSDLAELIYTFRVFEEVRRLHKRYYLLSVVSPQVAAPAASHRRWVSEWSREHGAKALAMVAPRNPLFAAMVNLIFRAQSLLFGLRRLSAFFTTEAEARMWLEEQRRTVELAQPGTHADL